jgi:predicted deacylase
MKPLPIIIIALAIVLIAGSALWKFLPPSYTPPPKSVPEAQTETPVVETPPAISPRAVIGTSVEGRSIERFSFGSGSTTLLFVGGVHGGYEWNSSALAYELIAAIETGTFLVPDHISLIVVPTLNPDGLFAATGIEGSFTAADIKSNEMHQSGIGRFNASGVDLNRNFDCKWQPESTWRNKIVSAGSAPFSEPEAAALRDLVVETNPAAVVFWHSQANTVYASECESGIIPDTLTLMNTYATAGEYQAVASFDAYPITGDAEGWLATLNIPAITVELESRTSTEWERNQAAMKATFALYAPQ